MVTKILMQKEIGPNEAKILYIKLSPSSGYIWSHNRVRAFYFVYHFSKNWI
jgi:hypothetical protein